MVAFQLVWHAVVAGLQIGGPMAADAFLVGSSSRRCTSQMMGCTGARSGPLAYATGDDANDSAKSILTPGTYADSRSAKQQVKLKVSQTASDAFKSTDFANEPHLSPELEDREAAVEVALLANAAHELVEAAEKENRQSKAAMLERERELEWIEKGSGAVGSVTATQAEAFQRSLLAAQLANRKSKGILTPGTFADSIAAEQQVELKVSQTASKAFESTDFSLEPHLSPELEDREAAVEAALLANAAHELVEAAEKESRQSKAAMLERERELQWIENEADTAIQQSNAEKRESFQRSLLSARIANDARVKELAVEKQMKEEWMGSEARAASMGGQECVSFDVASAAAFEAAEHALEEVKKEEHDTPPVAAASMLAETAERMILGEDLAMYDHSPELTVKEVAARDAEERYWEQVEKVSSNADQWRKEYVEEIKSYVQPTSSAPAPQMPSPNDDLVDSVSETTPKDTEKATATPGKRIIKRVQKGGLMQRVRERRRFIVAALAVVACRRLFLAYFGSMKRLL
ncbi:hypothetical protein ACHAXT_002541 [Thalassiosira profunda]